MLSLSCEAVAVGRMNGVLSCCFELEMKLEHGCVMLRLMFDVFMDGVIRRMKARPMSSWFALIMRSDSGKYHFCSSLMSCYSAGVKNICSRLCESVIVFAREEI